MTTPIEPDAKWTAMYAKMYTVVTAAYEHGMGHLDNGGKFTLTEAIKPDLERMAKLWAKGYDEGYEDGTRKSELAMARMFIERYSEGYDNGYSAGYEDGVEDG